MKVSDISHPTNATAMRVASSGGYRCVSTLSYTASQAISARLTMSPPSYPMDEPFLIHPDPDETMKNAGPGPFPTSPNSTACGAGVFCNFPYPCPHSGTCPTHTPHGPPLKVGGNNRSPIQGMSLDGPRTGTERGLPTTYHPQPCIRPVSDEGKPTPLCPITNTTHI